MFTFDAIVDAVQTGKKTWVNMFVTNETAKDAMVSFIDSQSEYTKKALKTTTDAVTVLSSETIKAYQNASKFDYTKFGEGIMKAYNATSKK
jgi:adenosylcobinamide amidohydrolase